MIFGLLSSARRAPVRLWRQRVRGSGALGCTRSLAPWKQTLRGWSGSPN